MDDGFCIISLVNNDSIALLPLFSFNISLVSNIHMPFVAEWKSTNDAYATETLQGYIPVLHLLLFSFQWYADNSKYDWKCP